MATPHIGEYYIFLLGANYTDPVKLYFKDHERPIKGRKIQPAWKEKVYLSPVLLQRKWIDYRFKERFIPSAGYDTVLPLELIYPFLNSPGNPMTITIRTHDKGYKKIGFQLLDEQGQAVFHSLIDNITVREEKSLVLSLESPGVYTVALSLEDRIFRKSSILVYRNRWVLDSDGNSVDAFNRLTDIFENKRLKYRLFCGRCGTRCGPVESYVTEGFIRKNYIPIKEYLDVDGLGMDLISSYIMNIKHPASYRSGLVHLLNMLRLASVEDEITIVTNLFKDDPAFAHYITDKLFLFDMIPLMENRELQRVLNSIDDSLLALALHGEKSVIVSKVLENVSKRRERGIVYGFPAVLDREECKRAKEEVHRRIKSYFEERFGRELKIPFESRVIYREKRVNGSLAECLFEKIPYHSGSYLLFDGSDIHELLRTTSATGEDRERCLPFDIETCGYELFTPAGISESTLYLHCATGIHYAHFHMYDWATSLEDVYIVENVPRGSVIPLRRFSSTLILTIGAIDGHGRPREQVIRLRVKSLPPPGQYL